MKQDKRIMNSTSVQRSFLYHIKLHITSIYLLKTTAQAMQFLHSLSLNGSHYSSPLLSSPLLFSLFLSPSPFCFEPGMRALQRGCSSLSTSTTGPVFACWQFLHLSLSLPLSLSLSLSLSPSLSPSPSLCLHPVIQYVWFTCWYGTRTWILYLTHYDCKMNVLSIKTWWLFREMHSLKHQGIIG